jgi:hypothetical protein
MEKCCNTCGMLACNKDKKTPEGSTEDWYSQANVDRLWKDCKSSGQFLICHSTDPNAADYGGNPKIKAGKETACLGLTLWIFMHIKVFEISAKCDFKRYIKLVGKGVAMSQPAMAEAAFNFAKGSTGFGLKGPLKGLLIPQYINEDREIVFPTGFDKVRELYQQVMNESSN